MKSSSVIAGLVAFASTVSAHATWQDLHVGSTDYAATCDRLPPSNNPVTDVTSTDIRCNVGGTKGISGKCTVAAGQNVTVEMHQQPNSEGDCSDLAIGGDHHGPIQVYMTKVSDASSADGSTPWFKIYESGLLDPSTAYWATDELNANCGLQSVKIPADIEPGDYLLRSEVIALHVASSVGGAQFYMSCFQITVTGGGSATPSGVSLPGAYSAQDPGILIDIYYPTPTTYVFPGPTVYAGGAGSGSGSGTSPSSATTKPATTVSSSTSAHSTGSGTTVPVTTSTSAAGNIAQYGQCGGNGWTGTGTCVSGSTCVVLNAYYSQCQ